jgi:predicted nucleotidyltransferase
MDLSKEQRSAITQWAEQNQYISEVRLFGSRARGTSRPGSDIDLAVTVAGDNRGDALGVYLPLADRWQRDLRTRTGMHVSLEWYGPESDEYEMLQTVGLLIWSRT